MVHECLYSNEKALVKDIARSLQATGEYRGVYSSINLANYKPDKHWSQWYGEHSPTLQPEIDLLLVSFGYRTLLIRGVEVKYIAIKTRKKKDKKETKISESYYAGIEQALSILRLGVDEAWLWHFFDRNVPSELIGKYVGACHGIIQSLKLPIGYSAYLVEEEEEVHIYGEGYKLISNEPFITPLYVPYYSTELTKKKNCRSNWWKSYLKLAPKNPLFDHPIAKEVVMKTREFLKLMLNIPSE